MTKLIAISASLDFAHELKGVAEHLTNLVLKVELPPTAAAILRGEETVETIKREKGSGKFHERSIQHDAIRRYWHIVEKADALLVANYEKKGIPNYIGGNAFLEMGFAHILKKPIYLLFDIPEMGYSDEIRAMEPVCLKGELNKIASLAS